ncbi:hypothetical protein GGI07_002019 [Coemansia sp. Benny D115]|nr:hypothetical protein GGI07_002019 [Coemansia sp. Benny D115]
MTRRPKNSNNSSGSSGNRQVAAKGYGDHTGSAVSPKALPKQANDAKESRTRRDDGLADAIGRRLRDIRRQLQRAEANEQKAGETSKPSAQSHAAGGNVAVLCAVAKELESLIGPGAAKTNTARGHDAGEGESMDVNAHAGTERQAVDDATCVLEQTLRLLYAIEAKTPGDCAELAAFYRIVASDTGSASAAIDSDALKNRLSQSMQHLRLLAQRSPAPVTDPTEQGQAVSYAAIATLVDSALDAPAKADRNSSSVSGALHQAKGSNYLRDTKAGLGVIMPGLQSVLAQIGSNAARDPEFNKQVAVPRGGFTFIASADIVNGSPESENDCDEDDAMAGNVAASATYVDSVDISICVKMPDPIAYAEDANTQDQSAPIKSSDDAEPAVKKRAVTTMDPSPAPEPVSASESASACGPVSMPMAMHIFAPMTMPTPAHHGTAEAALVAPAAFRPYDNANHPIATGSWPTTPNAAAAAAAAATGVPSMFGMMPMPYSPHMAMPYGYLLPHMYGMPDMSPGVSVAPPGMDPTRVPSAEEQLSAFGGMVMPAGPIAGTALAQGEFWNAGAIDSAAANSAVTGAKSTPPGAVSGSVDAASATKPAAPGGLSNAGVGTAAIDPYQAGIGALPVPGFNMASLFAYPQPDASNLSTAATGGGSENNDSVNSVDSMSNRDGSSRTNPVRYPQQAMPDGYQRWFAPTAVMAEYPQATHYVWPPQAEQSTPQAKYMQTMDSHTGAGLHHQGQNQSQSQSPHHNQTHNQYQGHQGQAYRRRGSGSNSSGAGSNNNSNQHGGYNQHHQYSRDRRNNNNSSNGSGGYRNQRWGNNGNNNSNGQHGFHIHRQHHQHSYHYSKNTSANYHHNSSHSQNRSQTHSQSQSRTSNHSQNQNQNQNQSHKDKEGGSNNDFGANVKLVTDESIGSSNSAYYNRQ